MGDIPDTVTIHLCDEHMGLLDEKLKPLRDRAQQLEQRVEELERQTRLMAGALSTYGEYTEKHPEYVLEEFAHLAQQEESPNDR